MEIVIMTSPVPPEMKKKGVTRDDNVSIIKIIDF